MMDAPDALQSFVVRVARTSAGSIRGTVEQVRTGRKELIRTVEDISRVIAVIAFRTEEDAMSLKGKHALVTGGSRGIGRGIALKLAESGARVAVHYYQKEGHAKATLEKLRAGGSAGFVLQA